MPGLYGRRHGVLHGMGTEGDGAGIRSERPSDVRPRESQKVFKGGRNQMIFALKKKNHCGNDLEAEQDWNV